MFKDKTLSSPGHKNPEILEYGWLSHLESYDSQIENGELWFVLDYFWAILGECDFKSKLGDELYYT